MRLTLRTLLAYLDDMLEPQKARELGDRINRSPEAAGLTSRIKNVLRRRRIGAPTVDESDGRPSANTVAAYIDNTLDSAAVESFELTAMDDDVVLAEVAAAHQILSIVMAEPVEVDSDLRLKMYGLAGMDAAPPTSEPSVPVVGARKTQAIEQTPLTPRTGKTSKPWMAGIALLLLLWAGGATWWVLQNRGLDNRDNIADAGDATLGDPLVIDADPIDGEGLDGERSADAVTDEGVAGTSSDVAATDRPSQSPAVIDETAASEAAASATAAAPVVAENDAENAMPQAPAVSDDPNEGAVDVASIFNPPAVGEMPAERPSGEAIARADAAPQAMPAPVVDEAAATPAEIAEQPPVGEGALPALSYQFISGDEVTLHIAADQPGWELLPPRAVLFPGEELVVPPLFAAGVAIEGGAAIADFVGPARGVILPPTPQSAGGVAIERGRLALHWPPAEPGEGLAPGSVPDEFRDPADAEGPGVEELDLPGGAAGERPAVGPAVGPPLGAAPDFGPPPARGGSPLEGPLGAPNAFDPQTPAAGDGIDGPAAADGAGEGADAPAELQPAVGERVFDLAAAGQRRPVVLDPAGGTLVVAAGEFAVEPMIAVYGGRVILPPVGMLPERVLEPGQATPLFSDGEIIEAPPSQWLEQYGEASSAFDRRFRRLFHDSIVPGRPIVDQLEATLHAPRFRLSQMAAYVFGMTDDLPHLVEALGSEHAETRQTAIIELKRIISGDEQALPPLRGKLGEMLSDPDADAAIELLQGFEREQLRSPTLSMQLFGSLESPNVLIRQLAISEIAHHLGQDFDFRPAAPDTQRAASLTRMLDYLQRRRAFVQPPLDEQVIIDPLGDFD